MSCYRIFNSVVKSELPLSGLTAEPEAKAQFELRVGSLSREFLSRTVWFHQWESGDRIWALLGKCDSGFLVRFPNKADFMISANKRLILCQPKSGIKAETICHLFLDQILPCLLQQQGEIALHASAVVFSAGAVAFVGISGRGKSTLSANLASNGFPLLTDDCLLLQRGQSGVCCVPSYPGIRLWPESATGLFGDGVQGTLMADYSLKQRFNGTVGRLTFASASVPLKKIYLMAESTEEQTHVNLFPLSPREAYLELLKHVYRLDVTDWVARREEFKFMVEIVEQARPYWLSYPHEFAFLPEVRRVLLDDLGKL